MRKDKDKRSGSLVYPRVRWFSLNRRQFYRRRAKQIQPVSTNKIIAGADFNRGSRTFRCMAKAPNISRKIKRAAGNTKKCSHTPASKQTEAPTLRRPTRYMDQDGSP